LIIFNWFIIAYSIRIKSNPKPVPRLEAEINQLVYTLYGLTPEEIAIVEGDENS